MDIDIAKLSDADLAYMEGFVSKCAELGVDPEAALKKLAGCGKKKAKKPALKKKAEGCCTEPGGDSACKSDDKETKAKAEPKKDDVAGGKSKPFGGKAAPLFQKKSQDMMGAAPAPEKGTAKRVVGGIGRGAAAGALMGGAAGGALTGAAGMAMGMPKGKGALVQLLKLMAAGAVGGAIPGAAAGGFGGGVVRAAE